MINYSDRDSNEHSNSDDSIQHWRRRGGRRGPGPVIVIVIITIIITIIIYYNYIYFYSALAAARGSTRARPCCRIMKFYSNFTVILQ